MTIEEQIYQHSVQHPDSIALITPAEQVTYAQLWERCLLAASNVKHQHGVKQGDRIILAASANIDFVYAYFGICYYPRRKRRCIIPLKQFDF